MNKLFFIIAISFIIILLPKSGACATRLSTTEKTITKTDGTTITGIVVAKGSLGVVIVINDKELKIPLKEIAKIEIAKDKTERSVQYIIEPKNGFYEVVKEGSPEEEKSKKKEKAKKKAKPKTPKQKNKRRNRRTNTNE